MRRNLIIGGVLVLAVTVAVLVVALGRGPGATGGTVALDRLSVYGQLPMFSLVASTGQRVTRDDLRGKVWVANFIYTECRETCPLQSLQIARLQSEFADAADLRFVSITVDPKHDTPEVLTRYATRYGARLDRWFFLTGDKREIYCLAKDGFHLSVVDQADASPPPCPGGAAARLGAALAWLAAPTPAFAHGGRGLLMHSARLVLVDRAARIRAYHLATDEASLKRLAPNLRRLLAERRD